MEILVENTILTGTLPFPSYPSANFQLFVFGHIQLKIIIAVDNLLQIKYHFSLNLKQVPNSGKLFRVIHRRIFNFDLKFLKIQGTRSKIV
jgi:hypothetical protein